ncbi:unnamed protein product [Bursaphelenchus okinawaensis]|uniref:Uncharacterized protein n=1 Tax=Bursaphelenchus okinawaensis TaxID=465554 RepID=A0A811JWB7_9BILA|nr:unnamed protein product [Bursaphelenchus okinawaensis]CAG9086072.1 unnamed protein product [Bursaphelenchus okinawaensis]
MKFTVALLFIVGLAVAATLQKPEAGKKLTVAEEKREFKTDEKREFKADAEPVLSLQSIADLLKNFKWRNVIPCNETCTNGGDVATCCRAHGWRDGVCDIYHRAFCR